MLAFRADQVKAGRVRLDYAEIFSMGFRNFLAATSLTGEGSGLTSGVTVAGPAAFKARLFRIWASRTSPQLIQRQALSQR